MWVFQDTSSGKCFLLCAMLGATAVTCPVSVGLWNWTLFVRSLASSSHQLGEDYEKLGATGEGFVPARSALEIPYIFSSPWFLLPLDRCLRRPRSSGQFDFSGRRLHELFPVSVPCLVRQFTQRLRQSWRPLHNFTFSTWIRTGPRILRSILIA